MRLRKVFSESFYFGYSVLTRHKFCLMLSFENVESNPTEFGKLTSFCEELIIRRETDFLHGFLAIGQGGMGLN